MTKPYEGDADQNTVQQYTYYLLSRQDYTVKGLLTKLKQRFPHASEHHQPCVTKCIEYGYLDDRRFGERYARQLAESGLGVMKIKEKMFRKHFPSDVITMAVGTDDFQEVDHVQNAINWREKWLGTSPISDPKVKKRIADRLARKGFSYDIVRKAIEHSFEA